MYMQIAKNVRVYVTQEQTDFIKKYSNHESFQNIDLTLEELSTARILADKSILVRKKLDNGMQYALNRYVRFVENESKK